MNEKLLSYLGLARAANLCSFGHDAAKSALRSGKARLCLLCEDASPRLAEEFIYQTQQARVPLHRIALTSQDIKGATQYKAAVITVNDKGFAAKIVSLLST
ncbi:MAG: ribosomal L7Ae/L30e/S12e/Gadd45 family protein [Oscillospiraceae bacterium]|nr:ribosomal L7Ae/L30e/S12e/Gadd45 family protein [Oscillospiraceae bacterium]